jgi:DNA repair protein RadA/Sms
MLISGKPKNMAGTCIACVMEGSRPILAEVQGLVTPTGFGNARRTATGFDFNRLNLLLAVLEKRLGIYFSNQDTYVNIVGGMKLDEPAADLAVAMALVSGYRDIALDEKLIAFGEIGLSGELRSVPRAEARVNEAARLGFTKCIMPSACLKQISNCPESLELIGVRSLGQAISIIK